MTTLEKAVEEARALNKQRGEQNAAYARIREEHRARVAPFEQAVKDAEARLKEARAAADAWMEGAFAAVPEVVTRDAVEAAVFAVARELRGQHEIVAQEERRGSHTYVLLSCKACWHDADMGGVILRYHKRNEATKLHRMENLNGEMADMPHVEAAEAFHLKRAAWKLVNGKVE